MPPKLNNNMKKIYIKLIFVAVLSLVTVFLAACQTKPPAIETVKDEFKSLIEASFEINDILFGEGLPVYARDGSDEEKAIYVGMVSALDNYEMVNEESKYHTADAIKAAADLVYSPEYIEPVYSMTFDGFADEELGITTAKYLEWDGRLYKSMLYDSFNVVKRTYNYDTMKIIKPSNGEYVNIEIESELNGEKKTIHLSFLKTANGWRLDSPTY